MTPSDYCYWLQGFVELHGQPPTAEQWDSIKEHLALVFTKVTKLGPGEVELPNTQLTGTTLRLLDLIADGPICGDGRIPFKPNWPLKDDDSVVNLTVTTRTC